MKKRHIDNGKPFDWGKAADDYGRFRDIYPQSYFENLESLGFAGHGQSILDIGTGTGVIPRAIYKPSLKITGVDAAENQIKKAKEITSAENKNIEYFVRPAEDTGLPSSQFDSIIAAQCYIYFDVPRLMKEIDRLLKPKGRFYVTWFAWLPVESEIAKASEDLILTYNPDWKGGGFSRDHIISFAVEQHHFRLERQLSYSEDIPFTKETWAGRIRATRGIGAVLDEDTIQSFDEDHNRLLEEMASEELSIPHLIQINCYKRA